MNFVITLGKKGRAWINYILDLAALFWKANLSLLGQSACARKLIWSNTLKQILFTGVDGLLVISSVSALLAMVIIIQAYSLLPGLGGNLTATLLVIIIIRELGPIITAFIIIGRSGTAIATELGNMKVSREIDALHSMGVDPIHYVVAPRLIGMVVSLSLLGIYFDAVGIAGGYLAANLLIDLSYANFWQGLLEVLQFEDIMVCLFKNVFSGIVIATVCCYHGLRVRVSSTEVPQQTTKAVVNSIFLCFFFNAIITLAFYI
jgi:phospholipid/cholesterol/gamma-HCH transport system permease protein